MKYFLLAIILLSATAVHAQTLEPAIADYRSGTDHVNAELTVINNDIHDMGVTLEPRYFEPKTSGMMHALPLPPWMHVKFDQSSAIIGPKGSHIFEYTVTCDGHAACWWAIEANIATGQTVNGLAVMIHLPVLGYMVQKEPLRSTEITAQLVGKDLTIANPTGKFGRINIRGKAGKDSEERMCVMYPNQGCAIHFNNPVTVAELVTPKGKLEIAQARQ